MGNNYCTGLNTGWKPGYEYREEKESEENDKVSKNHINYENINIEDCIKRNIKNTRLFVLFNIKCEICSGSGRKNKPTLAGYYRGRRQVYKLGPKCKICKGIGLINISDHKLKFGMYKNKTLQYILNNDKSYLEWLYKNQNTMNSLTDTDKNYINHIFICLNK